MTTSYSNPAAAYNEKFDEALAKHKGDVAKASSEVARRYPDIHRAFVDAANIRNGRPLAKRL